MQSQVRSHGLRWMGPVLLILALPGLALMLSVFVVSFFGNGPYDPDLTMPTDLAWTSRAWWWVSGGLASATATPTLVVLAAFTAMQWTGSRLSASSPRLLATGTGLAWLLAVMQLLGFAMVVLAQLLPHEGGAAIGQPSRGLYDYSFLVATLTIGLCAALIAWSLGALRRTTLTNPDPTSPRETSSESSSSGPPSDHLFRRPTNEA